MSHWNGNIATIHGGPRDLPKNYVEAFDAHAALLKKRGAAALRLASGTYILEVGGHLAIYFWGRAIVTYYSDGRVELNTHGYQTASTRDRMNRSGIRIGMRDGVPFVLHQYDHRMAFVDGMILHPHGEVTYPEGLEPANIALDDIIRRRRRNLARRRRWINGPIKKQDFPDVFYWACKSGGYSRHFGTIPEVFSTDLELGLTRTRRARTS